MKLLSAAALAIYFASFSDQLPTARATNLLQPRKTSILISPAAQPPLPAAAAAASAAADAGLDLDNIQGDILIGMKKKKQFFVFFTIQQPSRFNAVLKTLIFPHITTTTQLLDVTKQPTVALNVAFSQSGLTTLGVTDSLNDTAFAAGQFADAAALNDPGTANWVPAFTGTNIHGVFLLASDSDLALKFALGILKATLKGSATTAYILKGAVRPGTEEGHEHFGFMDGISQPAVNGFTANPMPGQISVDPGTLLLGEPGDDLDRPAWAKDGSFLAFRQLKQLVPEFDAFLAANPITQPGLTAEQGSALFGARMFGRWKSGAPVALAPQVDDPALAADAQRNNDFTYAFADEDILANQTRCPFSAHTRKMNPRADFSPANTINHIMRAGLPYGPEVTRAERAAGASDPNGERGLAFVSYQSDLDRGFRFIQTKWANNPRFFFGKSDPTPGVDPVIGALAGGARVVSGLDPADAERDVTFLTDFVVSRGGEYFFSPSLAALRDGLGP